MSNGNKGMELPRCGREYCLQTCPFSPNSFNLDIASGTMLVFPRMSTKDRSLPAPWAVSIFCWARELAELQN